MPEQLPQQPLFIEKELRNQQATVDLRSGEPLISHNEAIEAYGINGDIVALISLPAEAKDTYKDIAVVDYGEPDPDNLKSVFVLEGKPIPMMGKAHTRYGLRSLGNAPTTHLSTHVDVPNDVDFAIGRDKDYRDDVDASYKLGISDGSPGNSAVSRRHATLNIAGGKLTILDHSSNGTKIRFGNPEAAMTAEERAVMHEEIGEEVLDAAGVKEPQIVASPLDKYTEDYVKENPYHHMFDKDLSEDQAKEVANRINNMDLRTDEQKRTDAQANVLKIMDKQRAARNHKYNMARQTGASHEQAEASADSAGDDSYDDLLRNELRKLGLDIKHDEQ